eukprot:128239-Prorocentrum_minimum.AAC.1
MCIGNAKAPRIPYRHVTNPFPRLGGRMKQLDDLVAMANLINKESPDIIAIQEVRQAAKAPRGAKRNDGAPRQRDTLGTPSDKKQLEETQNLEQKLRTEPFSQYKVYWSLADWKYADWTVELATTKMAGLSWYGSFRLPSAFIKYGLHLHTSRCMCVRMFDEKAGLGPHPCFLLPLAPATQADFGSMYVLNTYVPNNGWVSSTKP